MIARLLLGALKHRDGLALANIGDPAPGFVGIGQTLDERPLLVPGTPEVREYRMRFWDKGTPNGDWTDVVKVTVSP